MTANETCWACDNPTENPEQVIFAPAYDIALCTRHWNQWVMAYALGTGNPPCSAHLADFELDDEAPSVPEATEAEVTAALDSWYSEALKGAHDQLRADVLEHARDRMRAAINAARAVQP